MGFDRVKDRLQQGQVVLDIIYRFIYGLAKIKILIEGVINKKLEKNRIFRENILSIKLIREKADKRFFMI